MLKNIFHRDKKPKESKPKLEIETYLVDAIDAFENKNYDEAIQMFSAIAKVDPRHPLAHLMLGRAFIEICDYTRAIETLFKHLMAVPGSIEGIIYLGFAYYACGENDRAAERFEQAMGLRSDNILIRENLAIAKISSGDYESAFNELSKLHNKNPIDKNIIELMVLTLGKLGRWETAKKYAEKL